MSRKSLYFICLAVIGGFILYTIGRSGFNWSLFVSNLRNVQPGWLAVSILATMMTYVARAFRWHVLLNRFKTVKMGALISTNVLGFAAIFLLGRAGEFVRPLWLTRQEGVPLTASVATIIVERVLDTLILLMLFGLALGVVQLPSATEHSAAVAKMKATAWIMVAVSLAG